MGKKFFLYINLLTALFFFIPGLQAAGNKFTVVIDPGHGGKDPGARGATTDEKTINLAIALKLGNLIAEKHKDVNIVYTRKNDTFIELNERANIANRNKADLFISIHTNAVKNSSVRGTETFTLGLARTQENLEVAMRENAAILLEDDYLQKYEGFDPNSSESYIIFEFMQNKHMEQSISLASEIQNSFSSAKRGDRGVKQAGLLVLRKTSMPSVLVELGFISNREEENFMKSADGQNKLARAIYSAFEKYKRAYDRKQGALANGNTVVANNKPAATTGNAIATTSKATPADQGKTVYKIQILTSDKKLPNNSRQLKGYKDVSFYQENGLYKYTYGESSDFEKIKVLRNKVAKDFKDAFIIRFKDGKRVVN
ncbi:MAG: N-acetylmuramoyl-L-alanine amidase [Tannerellaceae bacterium]|nr:N-acetylmuramoyl-L-alanine amidase [Tannerellaceae bacterium]